MTCRSAPSLRRFVRVSAALLAAASAACSTGAQPGGGGGPDAGSALVSPTFHEDVAPILQQRCQSCHSPGRIAPFPLVTYQDAVGASVPMRTAVMKRTMPPWGAEETPECRPRYGFRDDHRLSEQEVATVDAWVRAGTPEGDPQKAPKPRDLPSLELPGMNLEVHPLKPFVASGERDLFRCFVLDPKFTATKFLNGWNIVAGNPEVVHHVLVFADERGESLGKADADGGYDCFGGLGLSRSRLIGAWAPGAVAAQLPGEVATHLPAGTLLVMQIHYHPSGRVAAPDSTRFQMRLLEQQPAWRLDMALIGNFREHDEKTGNGLQPRPGDPHPPKFLIPAGARDFPIDMKFKLPEAIGGVPLPELRILVVGTHMHYVGTDMRLEIERPAARGGEPARECLVETPRWDFNWQRGYMYDAPLTALPTARAGDTLWMRCRYDNSLQNPFVADALREQNLPAPRDVTLGEETLDEMCLGVYGFVYPVR